VLARSDGLNHDLIERSLVKWDVSLSTPATAFIRAPALPSVRFIPVQEKRLRTDGKAGARMKTEEETWGNRFTVEVW